MCARRSASNSQELGASTNHDSVARSPIFVAWSLGCSAMLYDSNKRGLLLTLLGLITFGDARPVIAERAICTALPGTAAELAATPRADENLEMLAIRLSHGIVAEDTVYQRLVRDIGAIRQLEPKVRGIRYMPSDDGQTLFIEADFDFDEKGMVESQSGRYQAWNCLNRHFGVLGTRPLGERTLLVLKGRYDMRAVADLYAGLPGVRYTEPNQTTTIGWYTNIYVTPSKGRWHYVFDGRGGGCVGGCPEKAAFYFIVTDGSAPEYVGKWAGPPGQARPVREGRVQPPKWVQLYLLEPQRRWTER
jgi:hypothetical protein